MDREFKEQGLEEKFVWCPAGSYCRGSSFFDLDADKDERPSHQVTLTRGFFVQAVPVTQEAWEAVAAWVPSHFDERSPKAPVEKVSWYEAVWFCNVRSEKEGLPVAYRWKRSAGTPGQGDFLLSGVERLAASPGYRLPTEAEWEYAARAGTTASRYGKPHAVAWFEANSPDRPHPVAQKEPNAWGLYDMLGNVWEWCFDKFAPYRWRWGRHVDPLQVSTPSSEEAERVLRGGSWFSDPQDIRAPYRRGAAPGERASNIGLRLFRSS